MRNLFVSFAVATSIIFLNGCGASPGDLAQINTYGMSSITGRQDELPAALDEIQLALEQMGTTDTSRQDNTVWDEEGRPIFDAVIIKDPVGGEVELPAFSGSDYVVDNENSTLISELDGVFYRLEMIPIEDDEGAMQFLGQRIEEEKEYLATIDENGSIVDSGVIRDGYIVARTLSLSVAEEEPKANVLYILGQIHEEYGILITVRGVLPEDEEGAARTIEAFNQAAMSVGLYATEE